MNDDKENPRPIISVQTTQDTSQASVHSMRQKSSSK